MTLSWLVLFVLSILLQYGNLTNPNTALAVHDDGIFELDGNALDQAAAGDDWQNGTPGAADSLFIPGSVEKDGVDTTYFAQGGSKDHHDIDEWHYSATDVAPDKDELIDVFAAAYDTADGTTVYFGADKFDDSGDAQIGFWFFQASVSLGANGLFNGVHTVGDVLVLSDFTNGGSVDLICVYEWNPPGDDIAAGVPTNTGCDLGDNLTLAAAGAECDVSGPDGSFDVCAIVNAGVEVAPWPFVNKDGATDFGVGQFFEGGINLDELFDGDAPCFSGFLAETRSSQEVEAQLKDFALGNLNTCVPPTISTLASPSTVTIGGSATDTATLTGSAGPVTGTVTFWVCGPATPDCTSGGTQVGSPVTIVAGSATSAAVTPTAPGTYCFRAEYVPDAEGALHYTAASHTNLGSECFVVNKASPAIVTFATQSVSAGNAISDSATLSGGINPTGTITFTAYGPGADCSAPVAYTTSVAVSGNGTYGPVSFTPSAAGTYRWIAAYSGDANNNSIAGACNDAGETDTVNKVQPTITTSAPETVTIGGAIHDSALLAGGVSPTGSITFNLYGPGDATCSGAVAFTTSVTVNGNGTYGPVSFTPLVVGTYRWVASYSGDGNNLAATGACNDAGETDTVEKTNPTIATVLHGGGQSGASITVTLGTAVNDSSTLSASTADAGGTVHYQVFSDSDCETLVFDAGTKAVTNGVPADSNAFTINIAGTYYWQADYSGDAKNNSASSACNLEVATAAANIPSIVTAANQTVTIGASISDSATLSGGFDPTGSITFRAYGPNDATCVGAAVFTSAPVAVNGNGTYGPVSFTPATSGVYHWIALYSGDANNAAVGGACGDAGENDTVQKISPTIVTSANETVNIGGAIHDSATLSGGVNPTGSITFRAYGPNDATCVGAAVFTSAPVAVNGNGTYGPVSFTPATSGVYRWIAAYNGDANNNAATGACNDTGETDTVNQPQLTILKDVSGNTGGTASNGLPIAKVGDTLTFTLTYDITSPPANHGVIADPIPAGLEYVTGSATTNLEFDEVSYNAATRTLTWLADVVNVDGSVSFKVTVLATAPALAQPITNVATIDSDETLLDDDDAKVLVQVVLAETATPVVTLPPTDSLDSGEQAPSNPGFGLMLALFVLAGVGLVAGYLTPTPGRTRRQEVRRR